MNVLNRLENTISKHGVLSSDIVKLASYAPDSLGLKIPVKIKKDIMEETSYRNEFVRTNKNLIGKGSIDEQIKIKDYLSPMGLQHLTRITLRSGKYDAKSAKLFYEKLKIIKNSKNSQKVLFNLCNKDVASIISLLMDLTPEKIVMDSNRRYFLPEIYTEIPRFPNFQNHEKSLDEYIALLTHSTFYYKSSSRKNGIIPKILRNLMHPSNINTVNLRNVHIFNDVIYFFSKKWDFASCRELYSQMKWEKIPPNTKTFNLLLMNLVKNSQIVKKKLPFKEVIFYLTEMKCNKTQADVITWSTCYNLLLDDISRDIFLEKMAECNVPITQEFIANVLMKEVCDSTTLLQFLNKTNIPLTTKLFNLCIKKLVDEDKHEAAWQFICYIEKSAAFRLNTESLNILLRSFAESGRIDLSILTFNTLINSYGLKANVQTFHMLFKALTRNGYHENFCVVNQWLKQLMKKHTNNLLIRSYWIVKANSIAKFNIKSTNITSHHLEKAGKLLDKICWDDKGLKLRCWSSYVDMRKSFRFLGCIPSNIKPKQVKIDTSVQSIKKSAYRNRIKFLSIQNAKQNKILYAQNHFTSLKDELKRRGIIGDKL